MLEHLFKYTLPKMKTQSTLLINNRFRIKDRIFNFIKQSSCGTMFSYYLGIIKIWFLYITSFSIYLENIHVMQRTAAVSFQTVPWICESVPFHGQLHQWPVHVSILFENFRIRRQFLGLIELEPVYVSDTVLCIGGAVINPSLISFDYSNFLYFRLIF